MYPNVTDFPSFIKRSYPKRKQKKKLTTAKDEQTELTECSSNGPSARACTVAVFVNVPFITLNTAFLWKTTVTWRINNKAFNNCIHLRFGGK